MKHFLFTIFFSSAIFLTAQKDEKKEQATKYNEFGGLSTCGMLGFQYGEHPADFNTSIFTMGLYPKYSFIAPTDWFGVSIGTPLQFGLDVRSNLSTSAISFSTDLPAVVDLSVGSQANPYSEYLVGFFIGGGLNYNLTYFSFANQQLTSHSFGPVFHCGIKWLYYEKPMGFRISYMWGVTNNMEKDSSIIYDGRSYPTFLSLNLTYGLL